MIVAAKHDDHLIAQFMERSFIDGGAGEGTAAAWSPPQDQPDDRGPVDAGSRARRLDPGPAGRPACSASPSATSAACSEGLASRARQADQNRVLRQAVLAHPLLLRLPPSAASTSPRSTNRWPRSGCPHRMAARFALTKARILIELRSLIANPKVVLKTAFPSFRVRMQAEHGRCPRTTLYRWNEVRPHRRRWPSRALIDARTHTAEGIASEEAIEMFRGLYLTPANMSVAQCFRMVEAASVKQVVLAIAPHRAGEPHQVG